MSRWKAVIFDLDDTLFPERDYVVSGMGAVAQSLHERLGRNPRRTLEELCRLFDDGARGNTFDRWLLERELAPEDWVPLMVDAYRRHCPQIAPYPEVPELLGRLRRRHRLGLVSDGYLEVQKRKLEALGLARFFDAVVFSDSLGRDAWKPDPRPFEAVLKGLRVEASEAVYVGDNPAKDIRGARGLGMVTIRVRHSGGLHAQSEPATAADTPNLEIPHLNELESLLTSKIRPQAAATLATETTDCNLCGSRRTRPMYRQRYRLGDSEATLSIVRCRRCGLIYVSPRLTRESVQAVYRLDEVHTISSNYCWTRSTSDGRFRRVLARLGELRPDGRLLDVGCGSGQFLKEARATGRWEVLGVEPSAAAAGEARRLAGCTVHASTLDGAPLERGSFDVLTAFGVLEHLHDPVGTLRHAGTLLKPGGVLAVYVPNFHYLRMKDTGLGALVRRRRWSDLHPQEHLFHFTPRSLWALLEKAGFEVVDLDVGCPFVRPRGVRRWLKMAAYHAVRALWAATGIHLGGIEAIARRVELTCDPPARTIEDHKRELQEVR